MQKCKNAKMQKPFTVYGLPFTQRAALIFNFQLSIINYLASRQPNSQFYVTSLHDFCHDSAIRASPVALAAPKVQLSIVNGQFPSRCAGALVRFFRMHLQFLPKSPKTHLRGQQTLAHFPSAGRLVSDGPRC